MSNTVKPLEKLEGEDHTFNVVSYVQCVCTVTKVTHVSKLSKNE